MRKLITLLLSVTVLLQAWNFLETSTPDSFCLTCVLALITFALWLDYELELADKVTDMELEEWQLGQERKAQEESRIMLNKRIIRRELIRAWGEEEV